MYRAHITDKRPLAEILDFRLLECKVLHLLTQIPHLALFDLDQFHINPLVGPPCGHAITFGRTEEYQAFAFGLVSRRSADTVNVGIDIFRAIELDHPVHRGEIEPARGYVGRDEQSGRHG